MTSSIATILFTDVVDSTVLMQRLGDERAGAVFERHHRMLRDATAVIEATEARVFTPQVHVERAALARVLGDEATHQRELREAHRLFTEMDATARAEQVARELGT